MPKVTKENYIKWVNWVNESLEEINFRTCGTYTLGYRGKHHKICLIEEIYNVVLAYGMRDITHYVLLLKRRYELK